MQPSPQLEHFNHFRKKLLTFSSHPFYPCPLPCASIDLPFYIDLPVLDYSYKWSYVICNLLWLTFSPSKMFSRIFICSMHQYIILFYGQMIFYYMDSIIWMHHILFSHFSVSGHLGCFHPLIIMNRAAMNIPTQIFVRTKLFSSLEHIPWSGNAGHIITLCLTYWGTARLF